eukprot:g5825.t1
MHCCRFTVESKSIQEQLVTVAAKLLQSSEQQLERKAEQDVAPSQGNAELLEQLVKAKAELVSAKFKISEQDKEIAKLKLEDEDAKKIVDNTLAALDEERKAKLSIEAKHKYFISQQLVIKGNVTRLRKPCSVK